MWVCICIQKLVCRDMLWTFSFGYWCCSWYCNWFLQIQVRESIKSCKYWHSVNRYNGLLCCRIRHTAVHGFILFISIRDRCLELAGNKSISDSHVHLMWTVFVWEKRFLCKDWELMDKKGVNFNAWWKLFAQ